MQTTGIGDSQQLQKSILKSFAFRVVTQEGEQMQTTRIGDGQQLLKAF
jgi:hypothetical protein